MSGSTHGMTQQEDLSGLRLRIFHPNRSQIELAEAENIRQAMMKYMIGSIPTGRRAPFDDIWCKKLHREMFSKVWDWAGKYRDAVTNIGVPPHEIHTRLIQLLDDVKFWREYQTFSILEQATRLHHGLVAIHPFKNGNGRWARLAANIFLRQQKIPSIEWPATIERESPIRELYLNALRDADGYDFTALLALHKRYQQVE
jgi:Fic-DOC domain mobile mystery protein B